jgi:hypothetical protein
VRFRSAPKPVLIGYLNAHNADTTDDMSRSRQALEEFAAEQGFHLGDVLVERDPSRPQAAFEALIQRAVETRATAVAIPAATHFSLVPRVQTWLKDRLEHGAQVAVHVVSGPGIGAAPDLVAGLVDSTRYVVNLRTTSGREVSVTLRLGSEFVEIWHQGQCQATPDRERLRTWLAEPSGRQPFTSGHVVILLDREGISLSMPGLTVYPLPDHVLAELRRRI